MLESIVAGYPDADLGIHVVWAQMLGSDNEESARQISKMFDDPRVEQYWDPKRLLGTSYSGQVFPTYLADMEKGFDAALPADHWWRERERSWKSAKPEQAPLWDVAFTYDNRSMRSNGPGRRDDRLSLISGQSGAPLAFGSNAKRWIIPKQPGCSVHSN